MAETRNDEGGVLYKEEIISRSEDDTRRIAHALGGLVRPGHVISLKGDLGAGKTVFAQGMAHGLGVSREAYVCSPTFTLINEYAGRIPFYHVDVYRIGDSDELFELGLMEYLNGDGVCAVEWFEKFRDAVPPRTLKVELNYLDEDEGVEGADSLRRISITARKAGTTELAKMWMAGISR